MDVPVLLIEFEGVVADTAAARRAALVESLVIDVPVITRAGGFGGVDALSELLWAPPS